MPGDITKIKYKTSSGMKTIYPVTHADAVEGLGDIFDLSNYYSKSEIDNILTIYSEDAATEDWVTANTRSSTWTPTWDQVSEIPNWIGSSKPTYTAADVEARPDDWVPTWSEVTGKPIITAIGTETGTDTTPKAVTEKNLKESITALSRSNTWKPTWSQVTGKPQSMSASMIASAEDNTAGHTLRLVSPWDLKQGITYVVESKGYITKGVSNLTNYYKKTEVDSDFVKKTEVESDFVKKTTEIMGIDLSDNITKQEIIDAIGNAKDTASGMMSSQDKSNLDTLMETLGEEAGDSDVFVNNLREVLSVFEEYPEGEDLVTVLSGKASLGNFNLHKNSTDNPHEVTKEQVELGSVMDYGIATQSDAENKYVNNKYMTPNRVYQSIVEHGLKIGTGSSTAYRGDRGKIAYDHSNSAHAPSNAQKNSDITKAEVEEKLPSTFVNLTDGKSNLPYKSSIIIYGDSDKYYPVHFAKGDQNLLRTIKIWRRYSEQAPPDWNTPTHKGSLNLEWKGNYGGWGGAVYNQWIYENTSSYTTLLAGTKLVDNSYAIAFFLRGGGTTGALYHFASDQPLTWTDNNLTYTEPTAFYNQDKTFSNSNSSYEKYASAPRTTVDTSQIKSITVVKGNDSRLTDSRPASDVSDWAKEPKKPTYNAADVGARSNTWKPTWEEVTGKPSMSDSMIALAEDDNAGHTLRLTSPWDLKQGITHIADAQGYLKSVSYKDITGTKPPSNATTNKGTVTNVSASTTQISGMSMTVYDGTTTPSIRTSISNKSNFRSAIGAGTSNLKIGTTSTTAKAGNYHPTWAQVTDKPTFHSVATSGSYSDLSSRPSILSVADGSTGTGTGARFVSGYNLKTIIDNVIGNYDTETTNNKRTSVRTSGATNTAYVSELGIKTFVDGIKSSLTTLINQGDSELESSKQDNLGFTPEKVSNKRTSVRMTGTPSNAQYVTEAGIKSYVDSMIGSVYRPAGNWNAATNTPTLTTSMPENLGKVYRVSVGGTRLGYTWSVGDKLTFVEGGAVTKWDNVDDVTSVAGRKGDVILKKSDVNLGSVNNYGIASEAAAKSGTVNNKYMTPLRTKQAITKNITDLGNVSASDISLGTDTNKRLISASDLNEGINNFLTYTVPTSRTINSKPLTSNISLDASDVGAAPTSHSLSGHTGSLNYSRLTGTPPTWNQNTTGKSGDSAKLNGQSASYYATKTELNNISLTPGPIGPRPDHVWLGTQLSFEDSSGSFANAVDLKGEKGDIGPAGPRPEHQWVGTKLNFRNANGTWGTQVDLKGEKGDKGNIGPQGPAVGNSDIISALLSLEVR